MSASPEEDFAYFDVAADVGLEAWGRDLAGCFRQALRGVFNLIVPLQHVRPTEVRELQAQAEPAEVLLVAWLNEALYLHDVEGFVVHDLDRPRLSGLWAHARLLGEPVDALRHPRGTLVKAVTLHDLALRVTPERVTARLVLDI